MSGPTRLLQGSVRLRAADKLRLYWEKSEGLTCLHPLGFQTQCDAGFLSGIFDKAFLDEMTRRGYDVKTLRFSIEPQKGNQRFSSQRPNAEFSDAANDERKPL